MNNKSSHKKSNPERLWQRSSFLCAAVAFLQFASWACRTTLVENMPQAAKYGPSAGVSHLSLLPKAISANKGKNMTDSMGKGDGILVWLKPESLNFSNQSIQSDSHFYQNSLDLMPRIHDGSTEINGLSYLTFDGASSLSADIHAGGFYTVAMALKATGAITLFKMGNLTFSLSSKLNDPTSGDTIYLGDQNGKGDQLITSSKVLDGLFHTFILQIDNQGSIIWIDGNREYQATSSVSSASLERRLNLTIDSKFTGKLSEFMLYNHALSTQELAQIICYLNSKYDISSGNVCSKP